MGGFTGAVEEICDSSGEFCRFYILADNVFYLLLVYLILIGRVVSVVLINLPWNR